MYSCHIFHPLLFPPLKAGLLFFFLGQSYDQGGASNKSLPRQCATAAQLQTVDAFEKVRKEVRKDIIPRDKQDLLPLQASQSPKSKKSKNTTSPSKHLGGNGAQYDAEEQTSLYVIQTSSLIFALSEEVYLYFCGCLEEVWRR